MKRYRSIIAAVLSLTLAMAPAAYAAPSPQENTVEIEEQGPSGKGIQPTQAPGEQGQSSSSSKSENTPSSESAGPSSGTESSAASEDTAAVPAIQSEGAVLLDAETGTVLFGKNENTAFYPASITKLMTALLVVENCSLDDKVTFSETAVTDLESGAVTLNLTAGDVLSVEDCLYALLLKSANEVANGLAEKVSGSVSAFADKMNARAAELGCRNTHFVNPNGLNDTEHYTTPYDMALIARAAFANDTLRKIDSTTSYTIPATKKASARTVTMGHKMFYPTDSRYYPGIIGGKTGYTSKAGNTLVTGVDKDGVRLIAVVMKSQGTHYQDTKALLDYGFANRSSLLASGGQPVSSGQQVTGGPTSPESAQTGGQDGAVANGGPAAEVSQGTSAETGTQSGITGTWGQEGDKWYYIKEDGTRAAGEWLTIGNHEYWFDEDGTMAVGWRNFTNGDWYYFDTNGAMVTNRWVENTGKWFYLGDTGAMLKNTATPDGYLVDETGARR